MKTGHYPNVLKIANVISLDKGRSKLELGNFRPLSILSPINKVFKIILHRPMIAFWEKYDLFTNCQFGFRKKHSINLAITYIHDFGRT